MLYPLRTDLSETKQQEPRGTVTINVTMMKRQASGEVGPTIGTGRTETVAEEATEGTESPET